LRRKTRLVLLTPGAPLTKVAHTGGNDAFGHSITTWSAQTTHTGAVGTVSRPDRCRRDGLYHQLGLEPHPVTAGELRRIALRICTLLWDIRVRLGDCLSESAKQLAGVDAGKYSVRR
jgi:hypothetical protein